MSEPTVIAKSLDDLGEITLYEDVQRPDGVTVRVGLRALSSERVWNIRSSVTWPEPPTKDFQKVGDKVYPVYDFQSATYRQATDDATRLLALKMLLASMLIEIPGETEADKLDALKNKLGQYAVNALAQAVAGINHLSEEAVAARARTFRSARDAGAASAAGAGQVAT